MTRDMVLAIEVHEEPKTVFDTVATRSGLASFWAPDVQGDEAEGGELTFGFVQAPSRISMRVTRLDPTNAIEWECPGGYPFWEGTTLSWSFDTSKHGTKVVFRHLGFADEMPESDFGKHRAHVGTDRRATEGRRPERRRTQPGPFLRPTPDVDRRDGLRDDPGAQGRRSALCHGLEERLDVDRWHHRVAAAGRIRRTVRHWLRCAPRGVVHGQADRIREPRIDLEPGRLLAMRSVKAPFPDGGHLPFDDRAGGTHASIQVQGEPGAMYKVAAPLLARQVRRSVSNDLATLKGLLERSSGTSFAAR